MCGRSWTFQSDLKVLFLMLISLLGFPECDSIGYDLVDGRITVARSNLDPILRLRPSANVTEVRQRIDTGEGDSKINAPGGDVGGGPAVGSKGKGLGGQEAAGGSEGKGLKLNLLRKTGH